MEKGFPDVAKGRKRKAEENLNSAREEYLAKCKWKGRVVDKFNEAYPFHFFLTRVEDLSETHDEALSIMFPELLDDSLGTVIDSLHVYFLVDLSWLLAQYAVSGMINPRMTILYEVDVYQHIKNRSPHLKVTPIHIKTTHTFCHHHSKLTIFYYDDKSIRFVIGTANLIESDWEDRTQGIWISPKCSYLGSDASDTCGESETSFKMDLIEYLNSYGFPELKKWLRRIRKVDCSSIRVCFLGSIPGIHGDDYGHLKLGKLLKKHSLKTDTSGWTLIAQCSSIGSLGPTPNSWLTGEFARSLCADTKSSKAKVSVIYPTYMNVNRSIHQLYGGDCLPYGFITHAKQKWLRKYMMQWKSDCRHRTRALPHIKTYTKMSPTGTEFPWFVLTSANLSKAAWGKLNQKGLANILSHEVGVVFFPKFLTGKDVFTIKKRKDSAGNDEKVFPVPYDVPLTSYNPWDQIFLNDIYYPYSALAKNSKKSPTANIITLE